MHICGRLACNSVPLISCFIWNFCQENINVLPSSLDSPLLSLLDLSLLSFIFLSSSLSSSEESLELPLSRFLFLLLIFPLCWFLIIICFIRTGRWWRRWRWCAGFLRLWWLLCFSWLCRRFWTATTRPWITSWRSVTPLCNEKRKSIFFTGFIAEFRTD